MSVSNVLRESSPNDRAGDGDLEGMETLVTQQRRAALPPSTALLEDHRVVVAPATHLQCPVGKVNLAREEDEGTFLADIGLCAQQKKRCRLSVAMSSLENCLNLSGQRREKWVGTSRFPH